MQETILKLIIKGVIQGTGSYLAGEFLKKTFSNPIAKQNLDDLIYSINPFVNNFKGDYSVSYETIIHNEKLLNQCTDRVFEESNKSLLIRKQINDFLKSILIKDWFALCRFLRRGGLLIEAEIFYLGYKNIFDKNSYDLASWLNELSIVYYSMGKIDKRLDCLHKSLKIFNKLPKSRTYKKQPYF